MEKSISNSNDNRNEYIGLTFDVINYIKTQLKVGKKYSEIASEVMEETEYSHRTLRRKIADIHKLSKTDSHYENWLKENNIKEKDVKSVKAWTMSNGEQTYSVVFKKGSGKDKIQIELDKYFENKPHIISNNVPGTGIAKVVTTDWHIGAYIKDLVKSQNYNLDVLERYLANIAAIINSKNYKEVHISILGDLIESFSGTSKQNTFKELELWGTNAVIAAYEIIKRWLEKINNVASITIISGNHDRSQPNKELEPEGEIANLVAYFLDKTTPYQINYSSYVYTEVIDNICYINTHGDRGINKDMTKLVWDYGKQGHYNVVLAGHLHSRKKLINATYDNSTDFRMIHCPSLFTGNFYSETLGYTSTAGFYIIENFNDLPYVHDIPLK